MVRTARHVMAVCLAVSVLLGATGCSLVREMMQPTTTLEENLRYQRISAEKFIENWPDVDSIEFIEDGSFDGSGQWSASAHIVVEGKKYDEVIGPWTGIGDPLPEAPPDHVPGPVTVTYSDGSSEVLQ